MSLFSNICPVDRLALVISIPFAFVSYVMELVGSYLLPIMGATSDWPKVLAVYLGIRDSAEISLRDGSRIKFSKSSMRGLLRKIKEAKEGKRQGRKIPRSLKYYAPLDVNGKTVVDIGAYTADTAIYFANKGARLVIGFEPVKGSYDLGVKNIRAARLGNRIRMVNWAIASSGERFGRSFSLGLQSDSKKVSLRKVIKENALRGAVLKLDSEGSEYGILRSLGKEDAAAFDQMAIRYYRGYRNLLSKLHSMGYRTSYTKPAYYFADAFRTLQARGMIYASRQDSFSEKK